MFHGYDYVPTKNVIMMIAVLRDWQRCIVNPEGKYECKCGVDGKIDNNDWI